MSETTHATDSVTTPGFLLNVDDEERQALAAVGVELATNERDEALITNGPTLGSVLSAASYYLRRLAGIDRSDALLNERLEAERRMVTTLYADAFNTNAAERERLTERLETLRQLAAEGGAFADRQTHDLGFGVFGQRVKPEHVRVLDAATLLAAAKKGAPELVHQKITETVPHAKLTAHYKATGELLDGCQWEPSRTELVAKPREVSA